MPGYPKTMSGHPKSLVWSPQKPCLVTPKPCLVTPKTVSEAALSGMLQVRYCLHVQQRLLKEQWPIKLAEHHMARTVSLGDIEGGGPGGQVLFNGLRVRMAINTGLLLLHVFHFWAV